MPEGSDNGSCKEREDKKSRSTENMEPAPPVGRGFFPLDEELAVSSGSLTPKQQEHLAHLATWMPFERAREMLETLLGVLVSEPTVRRGTERAGALYEASQTTQSKQPCRAQPAGLSSEQQVISTDGAYVPLIKGEWAEVRTVAIGEATTKISPQGEREVQTCHLSDFSRMTDAITFGDLAEVEMRRRGVSQAKAVCAVTDGADWIQGFIDLHRPDAVRILDFAHAAEHLGLLIEALHQAGVSLPASAHERSFHVLKHRGPGLLLRWCDRLPAAITELEAVQKQLHYFRKREALMQYPQYHEQGWPLGSGIVESANKVVVQARLKGAGMHWEPTHVNPMLALRTAACSGRWDEAWQDIGKEQHAQVRVKRRQVAETRLRSQLASLLRLLLRFRPSPPKPAPLAPTPARPAATLSGSSRPSAHHPWKRVPACRPKLIAKN
jgi:hypothetical protein